MLQRGECCGSRTGSRTIDACQEAPNYMIDDDHSVVSFNETSQTEANSSAKTKVIQSCGQRDPN